MDYWFCPICGEKYKKDEGKCLNCGWQDLGYVDQIGGVHEGGCGSMPDGTDCGECSKGDCSFCPVWATHKRRKERYMQWQCPECGENLEIWYEHTVKSLPKAGGDFPHEQVDLIYHCGKCGSDWDSTWDTQWGDVTQSHLKRHYWG